MLPELLLGEEFFLRLTEQDEKIAESVAAAGCRHCGGPLHQSNYERKPRGGMFAVAGEAFSLRHSLCCGREGCRKRTLPPSLRFLGRRVYLEGVVLLASMVLQVSLTLRGARERTGVPGWTLRRWGSWWSESFPTSGLWKQLRANFAAPPPDESQLPGSLWQRLSELRASGESAATTESICEIAARLLAPATTQSVLEGPRFVRGLSQSLLRGAVTQKM